MTYTHLDPAFAEYDDLREEVHEFAKEVVRPAAVEIDRMSYEEYKQITEKDSIYWDVMGEIKERGYHRDLIPAEFNGGDFTAQEAYTVIEELAWGSSGFAMALGVHTLPAFFGVMTFSDEVTESFINPWMEDEDNEFQGSWAVTEPSHGSELIQVAAGMDEEAITDQERMRIKPPEVTSERDGDEWRITGEKAQWISSGPMATHTALHFDMDVAEESPGRGAIVPLDHPGVTQSDPIEKLGQRACPQGSIEFEDVPVPDDYVTFSEPKMLDRETAMVPASQILCLTSSFMATVSTGLARAAFEEALDYAREREQMGQPLTDHQSVKRDIYEMFEKVETSRAYAQRVFTHVWEALTEQYTFDASVHHALTAQAFCKQTAFEVANKALQLHGGNGITTDYIIEKLFRDARVKLIEDGTTEILGLEAADDVIDEYQTG